MTDQFWKVKSLDEMNPDEWESLCDGCALCCMHKIEDEGSSEVIYTNVACKLLDLDTCRCSDYKHRTSLVPDCLQLNADSHAAFEWLPDSCAYRRLAKGEDLPRWHPLVSGRADAVHQEGISMLGESVSESDFEDFDVLKLLEPEAE